MDGEFKGEPLPPAFRARFCCVCCGRPALLRAPAGPHSCGLTWDTHKPQVKSKVQAEGPFAYKYLVEAVVLSGSSGRQRSWCPVSGVPVQCPVEGRPVASYLTSLGISLPICKAGRNQTLFGSIERIRQSPCALNGVSGKEFLSLQH